MTLTRDELDLIQAHRSSWLFAAKDLLGWEPQYDKQREIIQSVQKFSETHVVSANGVGKTDIAAVVILVWLLLGRGIVITTANTWTQISTVLWERIRKIASHAPEPLGLEFNNTEVHLGEQWFAMGLSTNDEARFAGYHEERQLVVVEEAVGLQGQIWDAIDGILVGEQDRLLTIGNPLNRNNAWFQRVRGAEEEKERAFLHGKLPDSKVIYVSAFDTPNVQQQKVVVEGMVTHERVEKNRRKWGEDDPRWYARVLGRWPAGGDSGLFPLEWLDRAFKYAGPPLPGANVAGLDVARYGSDKSALAHREGGHLLSLTSWGGISTAKTAARAIRLIDGKHPDPFVDDPVSKPEVMRIDVDGLGAGTYDQIEEACGNDLTRALVDLEEWSAGASSSEPEEFRHFKDEAYWHFRRLLEAGQIDLSALDDEQREEVESQALAVGYTLTSKGQRVVTGKDELRKPRHLGRSPDELEALIMAFWGGAPYFTDESLSEQTGPYKSIEGPGARNELYELDPTRGREDEDMIFNLVEDVELEAF